MVMTPYQLAMMALEKPDYLAQVASQQGLEPPPTPMQAQQQLQANPNMSAEEKQRLLGIAGQMPPNVTMDQLPGLLQGYLNNIWKDSPEAQSSIGRHNGLAEAIQGGTLPGVGQPVPQALQYPPYAATQAGSPMVAPLPAPAPQFQPPSNFAAPAPAAPAPAQPVMTQTGGRNEHTHPVTPIGGTAPMPTRPMAPLQEAQQEQQLLRAAHAPAVMPQAAAAPAAAPVPGGQDAQMAAIAQALAGIAPPSTGGTGPRISPPPAPYNPGALQPQMVPIMQMLAAQQQQAPSLAQLLGGV